MTLRFEPMDPKLADEVVGLPLGVGEMWGARAYPYTFSINRLVEDRTYSASWNNATLERSAVQRIDGEPFPSLAAAEAACRRTLKALQRQN